MMSNSDESFGYIVFGVSLGLGLLIVFSSLILSVSDFGTGPLNLLIVYPLSVCAVSLCFGVYGRRKTPQKKSFKKSRLAAMLMAWAPGKGHDYLGYPGQGIKFLIPLAIGIAITAISVPIQSVRSSALKTVRISLTLLNFSALTVGLQSY
jgi:hypothetical protein